MLGLSLGFFVKSSFNTCLLRFLQHIMGTPERTNWELPYINIKVKKNGP